VFSNIDKTINPDDDSGLSVLSAITAVFVELVEFTIESLLDAELDVLDFFGTSTALG
jgi:hypothetical protein